MKKITLFLFSVFTCAITYAQAPANYYANATGTGYVLKTQLKNIITNSHNPLTYAQLWTLYSGSTSNNGFKDKYYENDGTILDIYSEKPTTSEAFTYTPISDQCGNYKFEGDCYNREHLIPQSYFDEQLPMKADAFHVWPTDGKVNGERNNYAFGTVSQAEYTSSNGSKRGSSSVQGFTGTVFEPIDEFKGDIARAYFYFATRYEDDMDYFYTNNPNVEARVMFDGSNDQVFNANFLNLLYQWHVNDPVSQRETDLNNYIFANQGNRNPYIDNPQYVYDVWNQTLSNKEKAEIVSFKIYPNPAYHNTIYIATKETIDFLAIYTIDGKLIKKETNPIFRDEVFQINQLQSGTYILKVKSNNRESAQTFIVK